jgi:heme oxygenase
MVLKDLTAEKHKEAESTPFMKAVFKKTLPSSLWADWTYQKSLFYHAIEGSAGSCGLLNDLPDIRRAFYLYEDFQELSNGKFSVEYRKPVLDYYSYIMSISKEPKRIMAHLYVWHMGDMFGGQMIKKIVPGPHRNLEFKDIQVLMTNIRAKLDDSMAEEANCAFDWAIKMMRDYDSNLEQHN